jgi:hypothetical protein
MGYIDREQVLAMAAHYNKTDYGTYLQKLFANECQQGKLFT